MRGLDHKEYGFILVANKLPAKYRNTATLSFLQNIPWSAVFDLFDPNSKTDGLHYACNETSASSRAKLRTLDDFKDLTFDKDHSVRQTTRILSNDEMREGDWIKCSKDHLYRAMSAYKQCYPPGYLVCVFLCLSESSVPEMEAFLDSSQLAVLPSLARPNQWQRHLSKPQNVPYKKSSGIAPLVSYPGIF